MTKFFLVLVAALALTVPSAADPSLDAKAALALAVSAQAKPPTFSDLYKKAVKDSRPLVIWVGYKCPSSANQLPGMLHLIVDATNWRDVKGPAVLPLVPGGDGFLYRADLLQAADCCATGVKGSIERAVAKMEAARRPQLKSGWASHVRGWSSSTNGACAT